MTPKTKKTKAPKKERGPTVPDLVSSFLKDKGSAKYGEIEGFVVGKRGETARGQAHHALKRLIASGNAKHGKDRGEYVFAVPKVKAAPAPKTEGS